MNIKSNLKRLIIMSCAVCSSVNASSLLEEVVVTAQKREQNIQEVGIAITAFTGNQTDALGWATSEDVAAQTPGLIATSFNGDSSTSFFVIRGLGQADFGDQHEAPTIVYLDGAYIANTGSASVPLFDIERIETLKGPQGTLFGRNATGGLIHILGRKPTEDFEGYVELELAEYDSRRIETVLSGPLADNVEGRLSVLKHDADGFIDNSIGPDLREQDNLSIKAQLQTDFGERFRGHIAYYYNEVDDISGGVYTPFLFGGDEADFSGFTPDSDPHEASVAPGGSLDKDSNAVTVTLIYDISDSIVLTSISNYQDNDKTYFEDSDSTPARQAEFSTNQDAQTFGQELRLNGTLDNGTWTAGVYYLNIDGDYVSSLTFPDLAGFANITSLGANEFDLETTSWAVFGQMDYWLTEILSVTVGVRYTYDEKDFDLSSSCAPGPNPVTGVELPVIEGFGPGFDGLNGCEAFGIVGGLLGPNGSPTVVDSGGVNTGRDDSAPTFKLQLDWHVAEDTLIYAGYNRGMKAGGYAPSSDAATFVEDLEYDKEILDAYEIGLKTDLFDNTVRFNAAAFYYDYSDYQAFILGGLSNTVVNLDAEAHGGEIEIIAHPAEGLDLMLGVSFLDATVKDVPGVGDQDMLLAPDLTVNFLGRKEWKLGNTGSIAFQVDGVYVDEQTANSINSAGAAIDSYDVWNARLTYQHNSNWEASVFVRNLSDEEYYTFAFDVSGFFSENMAIQAFAPPRWFGASVRYSWN